MSISDTKTKKLFLWLFSEAHSHRVWYCGVFCNKDFTKSMNFDLNYVIALRVGLCLKFCFLGFNNFLVFFPLSVEILFNGLIVVNVQRIYFFQLEVASLMIFDCFSCWIIKLRNDTSWSKTTGEWRKRGLCVITTVNFFKWTSYFLKIS